MPDNAPDELVVIEVFGEGKTDIGEPSEVPHSANRGVIPIVVRRLCGEPTSLRVKTKRYDFLQGKGLWQKVRFAKRQAAYNQGTQGAVFVLDTEGDLNVIKELTKGRDFGDHGFPMAVGVAHTCTETWLLADPAALQAALGLPQAPDLLDDPESLPAPRKDPSNNPKTELARHGADSQKEKDRIAERTDLTIVRSKCAIGFDPFANEVESRIRPLFD